MVAARVLVVVVVVVIALVVVVNGDWWVGWGGMCEELRNLSKTLGRGVEEKWVGSFVTLKMLGRWVDENGWGAL